MLASCGSGGSSGFRWATTRPAAVGAASMCDYHRNVAFDGGVLIDAEERETMIRQFAMITFDACRYGPKNATLREESHAARRFFGTRAPAADGIERPTVGSCARLSVSFLVIA